MNNAAGKMWTAIRGESAVHVIPDDDLIGHTEHDCVCGPLDDPVHRADGSIGWVQVHHSLDGRERYE